MTLLAQHVLTGSVLDHCSAWSQQSVAMNLQHLIQAIKDMSTSSQDLARLLQQLKVSEESLRNQPQKVMEALNILNPSRESLGYLFLL